MSIIRDLWAKLNSGKDYRKELVSTLLKRGTAMQIQGLMRSKGWTQAQLAEAAGLTQGVISRASNPDYGNLTFNTVIDIASGFDVAFVGRFIPFSDFVRWQQNLRNDMLFEMPSFEEENENAEQLLSHLERIGKAEAKNEKHARADANAVATKPIRKAGRGRTADAG